MITVGRQCQYSRRLATRKKLDEQGLATVTIQCPEGTVG